MEIWKDIPGYEGIYQASNFGRIRSAPGKITSSKRFDKRVWKCRVLKQKACGRGDYRVSLWKDGIQKDFLVARLIAMTWCSGFVDGFTVNHKDGDFKNNRADNLEWLSRADNIRDGLRTGLYNNIRKGVRLISEDSNTLVFQSMRDASRYLGKCDGYVSGAIARGRTVRDLSGNRYSAIPF